VPAPVIHKPSPKKETTRIQMAPDPKTMPKATVKLSQSAPAASAPAPTIRTSDLPAPEVEQDSLVGVLGALAAVVALISAILSYLAFSA
jgi:hypothetical protein